MQSARLIGGAGTGKTTELVQLVLKLVQAGVDPMQLGYFSFTRTARQEAASRVAEATGIAQGDIEQHGWFKTLHSLCYRVLRAGRGVLLADDKESREWFSERLGLGGAAAIGEDDQPFRECPWEATQAIEAVSLSLWDISRNRLLPLEVVRKRMERVSPTPGEKQCRDLIEKYENAKLLDGRLDFTDLLGRFAGWKFRAGDVPEKRRPEGEVPYLPALIGDEFQDTSALSMSVFTRLCVEAETKWCYMAGDPFQCQPAGTMVRTRYGDKAIESLDPESDWLIAYNRQEGQFYGTVKRIKFQKASRFVNSGEIVEITLEDGQKQYSTANHKWYARTDPLPKFGVYLMQRGNRWRVGTIQLYSGSSKWPGQRFGMRCANERADSGWILEVFDTDFEARMNEQIINARFGIPQTTFETPSCSTKTNLTRDFIDGVFTALGDLTPNGIRCLRAYGREYMHPAYQRGGYQGKSGLQYAAEVQACNLLPGLSRLPKRMWTDGRIGKKAGVYRDGISEKRTQFHQQVEWVKVVATRRLPAGEFVEVFSLNVEKHHTYISDGYVTCNSIYGWAGSDSTNFMETPVDKQRIATKSWRCAAPILSLGERTLAQLDRYGAKEYFDRGIAPADHEGRIDTCWTTPVEVIGSAAEEWLILTRTNRQASFLAKQISAAGLPWRPTRGRGGYDAPMRMMALAALKNLEDGGPVNGEEWRRICEMIPAKDEAGESLLMRGTKTRFDDAEERAKYSWVLPSEIAELGATEKLMQAIRDKSWPSLLKDHKEQAEAVRTLGVDACVNPRIRIGTVHCSPPDERVLTTNCGWIPISQLKEGCDRLVSYTDHTNSILRGLRRGKPLRRMGYEFRLANRFYEGAMITIETEASKTRVTPNHVMCVRFAQEAAGKFVVYLMRRGDWWRVGRTTTFQIPYRSGGILGRLATERATDAWILAYCQTREEAIVEEARIAATFGIPTITFEVTHSMRAIQSRDLHRVHESAKYAVAPRVGLLLEAFGLYEDRPLYNQENAKRGVRHGYMFHTIAANLVPGLMEIPVLPDVQVKTSQYKEKPVCVPFTRTDSTYSGMVYSLDVLPHHHYVSGGAIVHNSAKGQEADNVCLLTTTTSAVHRSSSIDDATFKEEVRVAYVGVTRARKRLVLLHDPKSRFRIPLP